MSLNNKSILLLITLFHTSFAHCLFFFTPAEQKKPIIIMINPAGDAQHTGRKLDDTFERSVTLQLAEKLKKIIEERFSHVTVILTRSTGEVIAPLQSASFANRMNTHFYLSLHCYNETEIRPSIYLYQFSYGNNFITKQFDLAITPYDQAHIAQTAASNIYGTLIKDVFAQEKYSHSFILQGIFKIPFKPLIGVQAPAIAVEIGMKHKDSWHLFIEPIIESLLPIIEKLS